ncbi:hypothetical protein ACQP06_11355 [Nocardia sp. CA-136227]|uniref:hypothetical protein n=1 Tax=Nocardia sp. CA-136227 TaxID=3239979 RepID=UPI003D97BC1D
MVTAAPPMFQSACPYEDPSTRACERTDLPHTAPTEPASAARRGPEPVECKQGVTDDPSRIGEIRWSAWTNMNGPTRIAALSICWRLCNNGRARVVADWGNLDHRFLIEEGLAAANGDFLVWTEQGYQCLMNLWR